MLARSPEPGTGKTRLRAALAEAALGDVDALVRGLVADTLARTLDADDLVIAADGDQDMLRALAGGDARLVAQPEASFGERIENALAEGFRAGPAVTGVLQLGTDSPTLPPALIEAALAALQHPDDAALIPAVDGGWVGLALARPAAGSLTAAAIRWSTGHAAADTVTALHAAGRQVSVLPPWYDVDGLDDLDRLRRDPAAPGFAPRTLAALHRLDQGGRRAVA